VRPSLHAQIHAIGQPLPEKSPSTIDGSHVRVPELDGLRGIAIALVMLVHFGMRIPPDSPAGEWVWALCRSGWCGVDLFFVLSGFLITGILLDTCDDEGYYHKFFARRVLRIFPLYYGVLFVVFVALPLLAPETLDRDLQSKQWYLWTYVSNFISIHEGAAPWRGTSLNFAHFWSLAIEEQFYLCWPFVVHWAGPRRLKRLCLVLIVLALPLRLLAHSWIGPFAPYYLTPCRVDTLAWGALAAVWVRTYSREELIVYGRRLVWLSAPCLAAIFVWRRGLVHIDPVVTGFGFSLLAAGFTGVVVLIHCAPQSPWNRPLRGGVLQSLGRFSYATYVFHGLLQVWLWDFAEGFQTVIGSYFPALALYVLFCGCVSYGCARLTWPLEAACLSMKRCFEYDCRQQSQPDVEPAGRLLPEPLQAG
jgi:peptidoglycan/LPS O-acetylase OafA/YrhL